MTSHLRTVAGITTLPFSSTMAVTLMASRCGKAKCPHKELWWGPVECVAAHDGTAPRAVAGVGMFYASVIVVGYLILREVWTSFNRSKLSFDFYRPSNRGVLYHGCSPMSVVRFVYLTSTIQAMLSYSAGVAITIFVL